TANTDIINNDNLLGSTIGQGLVTDNNRNDNIEINRTNDPTKIRKRSKQNWTPELDNEVIRLRDQGLSWTEIASILGISHRVLNRRYERQLNPLMIKEWTPSKVEELDRLVAEGKSW